MSDPIVFTRQKLPVKGGGRCIYCNSDGDEKGLHDEHAIPFCLGGNVELLAASCARCEGVTSYLDGYLANATFRQLRIHSGVQSRSGLPTKVSLPINLANGMRIFDFDARKHPYFLHMPVWRAPGIMRGKLPNADFGDAKAHLYWYVPPDLKATLSLRDGDIAEFQDSTPMPNVGTFARAITKIAYCNAVLHYGLDGFRSLVIPDIILGKYSGISHFVGCEEENLAPPPDDKAAMHVVHFGWLEYKRLRLLTVKLRLFAHSGTEQNGMPIYTVIVGTEGKPSSISRCPAPKTDRVIAL